MREISTVVGGAIVALAVLGCSPQVEDAGETGAWSDEVRALGEFSDSQIVRDIAADGVIDESENAEIEDLYLGCLADLGYDVAVETDPDTGTDYMVAEGIADEMVASFEAGEMECGKSTGWMQINALYREISTNPQNIDLDAAKIECLVDRGLAEKDMSVEQFRQAMADGEPVGAEEPDASVCYENPLGAEAQG